MKNKFYTLLLIISILTMAGAFGFIVSGINQTQHNLIATLIGIISFGIYSVVKSKIQPRI